MTVSVVRTQSKKEKIGITVAIAAIMVIYICNHYYHLQPDATVL